MMATVIAVVVVAVIVYFMRNESAGDLPPLPDLSAQATSVRHHLQERHTAARNSPASAGAVGALCLAFHADLFYEQADRCYAVAASLDNSDWRPSYYRALLQSERGGGHRLVERLRPIAEATDFGPAWLRLGDAEFKAGRYDRAEAAWQRAAVATEPDRTGPPNHLRQGYGGPPKLYAKAEVGSQDSVSGDAPAHAVEAPMSAYASLGLARIALARNDPARACATLERVTGTTPRFGSAYRLLAECYTALGRTADAGRVLLRANRLPPYAPYADPMVDALARESRNSTFLLRQASEAELSVNAEWAEHLTRRALEFDPANPDVVAKLGRILRMRGRHEEALDVFVRYQEMVPGDFQGLAQLGSVLSDLGRFGDAEPLLRRALKGLDDALTHYNLALLLARTGRLEEAARAYQIAVERDPSDTNARINLASVLVRQRKLEEAARELGRVLELDPENAAAHTNYGIVLLQQKQIDRAVREFETALRLDPAQREAADALLGIER